MKSQFIKAFGQLQELFQELNDQGKILPDQAIRFDEAQKVIINYSNYIDQQLNPVQQVVLPWDDQTFTDAWNLWKQFKKEQFSFNYKPIGEQSALQHLAEISGGQMSTAIAILKQSRDNGWRGLFELRKPSTKNLVDREQNAAYKQHLYQRLTNK